MFHDGIFPNTQSRIPMGFVRGPRWLGFACGRRRLHFVEEDDEEQGETKKEGGREGERKRERRERDLRREKGTGLSVIGLRILNLLRRLEPQAVLLFCCCRCCCSPFFFFVLLLSFLDRSCQRDLWRKKNDDDDEAVEKNACRRRR